MARVHPAPFCLLPLLLLLALLALLAHASAFDPTHLHLIDSYRLPTGQTNLLFRGGTPLDGDAFDTQGLMSAMTAVAGAANLSLPASFRLIDVCLLTIETGNITVEQQYFASQPEAGLFVHWPTYGASVAPSSVSAKVLKSASLTWLTAYVGQDALPQWIPALRSLLTAPAAASAPPTVIYVHCILGYDRTGEISGAYAMQYKNTSFAAALALDNTIQPDVGRPIDCISRNAMEWYCYHLLFTGAYHLDNCTVPASAPPCSYDVTLR